MRLQLPIAPILTGEVSKFDYSDRRNCINVSLAMTARPKTRAALAR
jgi:hypothetical protein